jgi:hypothetical protein
VAGPTPAPLLSTIVNVIDALSTIDNLDAVITAKAPVVAAIPAAAPIVSGDSPLASTMSAPLLGHEDAIGLPFIASTPLRSWNSDPGYADPTPGPASKPKAFKSPAGDLEWESIMLQSCLMTAGTRKAFSGSKRWSIMRAALQGHPLPSKTASTTSSAMPASAAPSPSASEPKSSQPSSEDWLGQAGQQEPVPPCSSSSFWEDYPDSQSAPRTTHASLLPSEKAAPATGECPQWSPL